MTSPVLIESRDDEMTMSFVLPSKYTRNDLPSPNNDQVVIHEVPEYTVAVITFTGSISEDIKCKKEKELRDACSGDGVKLASTSVYAGYCPPWTPWFWRTNEIHIPLVV